MERLAEPLQRARLPLPYALGGLPQSDREFRGGEAFEVAQAQQLPVRRAQLLQCGAYARALRRRYQAGERVRLHPGVLTEWQGVEGNGAAPAAEHVHNDMASDPGDEGG